MELATEFTLYDQSSVLASILPTFLLAVVGSIAALALFLWFVRRFLYVCRPSEILIFSGRAQTLPDGRRVGYGVVAAGRSFRRPFVERVHSMDISLISVPMAVHGAYSEGGIPLSVNAIANVKVSTNPKMVGNAIERFLGRDRQEIARVAKETLEGHLRGVLATLTPEEVNQDRLKFANRLKEEVEDDLGKLGLQLDTLKIQHVSDERNYLESIGRKRIAEILRDAEVAESDALRAAEEAEAAARARGAVAKSNASASIQAKENELRQITAELEAEAKSEEERTTAAAEEARAQAEQELQGLRAEVEQLRLSADVTIPAQIDRQVQELIAAGQAATISANGAAQAKALGSIAEAWASTGGKAMEMYVLQHLDDIVGQVSRAASRIKVGEVNLIDGGDGKTLPAFVASYPATMGALFAQISSTIGVDLVGLLGGPRTHAQRGLGGFTDDDTNEPQSEQYADADTAGYAPAEERGPGV
ncbi:MAG: flotillin family protein [Deltaproteobacteria bacterium]|nr:flotillin family protein [Deltaproteobacteria bacterium]